jgi:organic radical activating enzyme
MKPYHADELTQDIRRGDAPVVLFGAGDIGKLAHHALMQRGIRPALFCDNNRAKWGRRWRDVEIVSPGDLAAVDRRAWVFVCGNYLESVGRLLEGLGFANVVDCADLLERADFADADLGMNAVFIARKVALHQYECRKARERRDEALVLKYLDVVVTERCSMKCQDCSNLMQYYERPEHSDMALLQRSVDHIVDAIDHIYEFRVLGGEPFVNRQLFKVVEQLTAYDKTDRVVIYTNATIVPKGETLACLRHPKVALDITNYGVHSRKYDELIEVLEANGVSYLTKVPEWTDSGRIKFVERPADELDRMFANCCVNDVLTLLNGRLYRCPFSANGTNLGAIPEESADVIDLTEALQGEALRDALARLYAKSSPLRACSYCNGRDYSTPRITAGLQIRRPLPLPLP